MKTETTIRTGKQKGTDANRDPLTGAQPVGTGVGTAGVGLVAGAAVGGLAGKGVAEKMDPTTEDTCWKSNYSNRLFVGRDSDYAIYQSAYRMDFEVRAGKN